MLEYMRQALQPSSGLTQPRIAVLECKGALRRAQAINEKGEFLSSQDSSHGRPARVMGLHSFYVRFLKEIGGGLAFRNG